MREVGAPEYTDEELEFTAMIAAQFPKRQKIDALRKSKVPNHERFIDVDLPTDILDP